MTWSATVNGIKISTQAEDKGELLRLLKSAGILSNYWYGPKIRRPIAFWSSPHIVDLYENGVCTHDNPYTPEDSTRSSE